MNTKTKLSSEHIYKYYQELEKYGIEKCDKMVVEHTKQAVDALDVFAQAVATARKRMPGTESHSIMHTLHQMA